MLIGAPLIGVVILLIMRSRSEHAKIRRNGLRTMGVILRIESEERAGWAPGYGGQSDKRSVYHIKHEFADAQGIKRTERKTIKRLACLKEGSNLTVYYLPDSPDKNTIDHVVTFGF